MGGGGLDGLEGWAAEERARDAARSRARVRWLLTQAEEDGRFAGVLAGLAEAGTTVSLTTAGGRQVGGRLAALGEDFVAVATAGGTTLVALAAVTCVRAAPGGEATRASAGLVLGPDVGEALGDGDGDGDGGSDLAGVLGRVVAERPRVSIHGPGTAVSGELRAVGADMVVVRSGSPPALAYLPLASLYEISFLDSG